MNIPNYPLLEKQSTYSLRGICMLFIILHHVFVSSVFESLILTNRIFSIIYYWGYLGTGVFFLLSGFGLYSSIKKNKIINLMYARKHIIKMFQPYIFVYLFLILYYFINSKSIVLLLIPFLKLSFPTTELWFYKVIFVVYLFTFVVFSLKIKDKYKVIVISIITLLYYLITNIYGFESRWFNTIFNFPIGMILAINISRLADSKSTIKTTIFSFIFTVIIISLFVITKNYLIQSISSIAFSLFVINFSRFVDFKNKFFEYIGENSLSFYLFHLFILNIFSYNSKLFCFLIVLLCSFIMTYIFKFVIKILVRQESTISIK